MAVRQGLLVVPDATACARWEHRWIAAERHAGAWRRPPVRSAQRVLDDIVLEAAESMLTDQPISDGQSIALWERVILDGPDGRNLISGGYAASMACQAWELLHQFGLDWRTLRPYPDELDFSAFLGWCSSYEQLLYDRQWVDRALAIVRLLSAARSGEHEIGVCGPERLLPATRAVLKAYSRSDHVCEVTSGQPRGRVRELRTADARTELAAAAEWATARLRDAGDAAAVAVVVADTRAHATELDSVFGDLRWQADGSPGAMTVWRSAGDPALTFPPLGAAVGALECLAGRGGFREFSRWLRSPFFVPDDADTLAGRMAFEASFRTDLLAQWRFADAYRHGGLAGALRSVVPGLALAIDRALARLERGDRRRHPSEWAAVWEQCLRVLGWNPDRLGTPDEVLGAWDSALQSFASLSAMIGPVRVGDALDRFRRVLATMSVRRPMPAAGLHVFGHADEIGPGYAGIWITGFTDRTWPAPVRLNPLLPARLQRANEMPWATPALAQTASQTLLDRVLRNAPEIVVSSPSHVGDVELLPSTALGDLPPYEYEEGREASSSYYTSRIGSRQHLPVVDAVPRAVPGHVRGGMRILALQSACPLRAFCELRLGAVPLEPPARGISPRVRGVIMHRALELVFAPFAGSGPFATGRARNGITDAVRRAAAESVGYSDPPWDLITRLETDRTARAIERFLEHEERRPEYEIVDVERRIRLEVDGWSLSGRIDRIDRLSDGTLVILDYKTGALPAAAGWFADRLREPQMPAYALAQADSAGAFAIVSISDQRIDVRAAGNLPEGFRVGPGRPPADIDWQAQLGHWRAQIAALLDEFGSGDVRVFVADSSLAAGAFAVLTRIHAALERRNPAGSSER